MKSIFPEPVLNLPRAAMPFDGVDAYLSQSDTHQIIFMEFDRDLSVPAHAHESQWGIVLEGKIELTIDGKTHMYTRGDRYFIPKGAVHSANIFAGYTDITFFNQPDRYKAVE